MQELAEPRFGFVLEAVAHTGVFELLQSRSLLPPPPEGWGCTELGAQPGPGQSQPIPAGHRAGGACRGGTGHGPTPASHGKWESIHSSALLLGEAAPLSTELLYLNTLPLPVLSPIPLGGADSG